MQEIRDGLYVGDESDCGRRPDGAAIVHACKDPCHRQAVGYSGRKLPSSHRHYLYKEDGDDLYLNLIDPPRPLFKLESFEKALEFMREQWADEKPLLVHCNQGQSRAPSLGLLFMAKELGDLPASSYLEARQKFSKFYPIYDPGKGIQKFLQENWAQI
jgi:hypothetical protein